MSSYNLRSRNVPKRVEKRKINVIETSNIVSIPPATSKTRGRKRKMAAIEVSNMITENNNKSESFNDSAFSRYGLSIQNVSKTENTKTNRSSTSTDSITFNDSGIGLFDSISFSLSRSSSKKVKKEVPIGGFLSPIPGSKYKTGLCTSTPILSAFSTLQTTNVEQDIDSKLLPTLSNDHKQRVSLEKFRTMHKTPVKLVSYNHNDEVMK